MKDSPTATERAAFEMLSKCVAGRTHKIARTIDGIYNEELRSLGLRNTQLTILCVLAYVDEITVGDLADGLVMERSTLSRTLAKLKSNGWIASESESRSRLWRLTPAGRSKVRAALRHWRTAQKRAARVLGRDGARALAAMGDRVGSSPSS